MADTLSRLSPHDSAALSALFSRTSRRAAKVIVPLNDRAFDDGHTGTQFYCVHSLSGAGGTDFGTLAKLMPDVRFYGIQAPTGKMVNAVFGASVEALADHYADALMEFQPTGPFLLGGWSAGAIIALEIAQTLIARDREVRLLAIIDAAPENTPIRLPAWHPLYLWEMIGNLPGWVRHDARQQSFRTLAQRLTRKLRSMAGTATARGTQAPAMDDGHVVEGFMDLSRYPAAQKSFMKRLYDALVRYEPKSYPGKVVVYEADIKPLFNLPQVGRVWRRLASGSHIVHVGGTHLSILREPHVTVLADDLRQRVADVSPPAPYGIATTQVVGRQPAG